MIISRRVTLKAFLGGAVMSAGGCAVLPADTAPAGERGPLVRGISYVGISVSDVERAAAYYAAGAGLPEIDRRDLTGVALDRMAGKKVSARTRTLRSGSGQIRLMQFEAPSADARAAGIVPVQGSGITHVCFQSPDTRPIFPRFVGAGARPLSRTGDMVQLRPDVPVKYAYIRDADGVMIEIEQLMMDNLDFSHRMRHVAIASPDIDRAVGFYAAILGKPPRERRSNLVNRTLDITAGLDDLKLDVAWFQAGNLELEIWEYLNPPPVQRATPRPLEALGHNMIVFDVYDPASALQMVAEAGGLAVSGVSRMDDGDIAFGRDPDGNLIGFFRPGSDSSPFLTRGLVY